MFTSLISKKNILLKHIINIWICAGFCFFLLSLRETPPSLSLSKKKDWSVCLCVCFDGG